MPLKYKTLPMTVAKRIESAVSDVPVGTVFTVNDLDFPKEYGANIKVKLNRMVRAGLLQRLANGKYYRAKTSVLGQISPSTDELIKDLLYSDGKISGYITGLYVWDSMALTTQFSATVIIGVNGRKASLIRGNQKIKFINQANKITHKNIHLLQILDALRFIKIIPDTSVAVSLKRLGNIIKMLSETELNVIVKLAMKYPPRVRAMLGAILDKEKQVELSDTLYESLNQLSEYRLGICRDSDTELNTKKWHLK